MQPKRKQGPSSRAAQPPQARKPQGPFFKTGDYVPLAIIIVKDGRPHNHHLPQKLFALKDFKQADALLAYHFQHPQQPAMLDPRNPDVNAFNSAVVNMHKWMIANGYCRQEGTSDLKVHVWTEEEMAVARAEEAELRKQITEGNLSPEALATLKAAGLDLTDIQLQPAEDRTQVNVGTVGHVDHGEAVLARSVSDGGQAFDASKLEGLPVPEAYLAEERPEHELDALLMQQVEERVAQPAGETISLEEMEAKFTDADPEQVAARADRGEDVLNDDVRKSYPEPAISAAELLAADPKGGL